MKALLICPSDRENSDFFSRRQPLALVPLLGRTALDRAMADLARRLPQASETTAANTVAAAPRLELLHPGTARYLREAGLLRD